MNKPISIDRLLVFCVLIILFEMNSLIGSNLVGQEDKRTAAQDKLSENSNGLRILSYNIHHGAGVDGKLDLKRIAKVIKESDADLVALQEVDVKTSRSNGVDQAAKLAEWLGMESVFRANIKFGGGQYGNAVLSRFPILKAVNRKLPNVDKGEQRGLLQVQVKPKWAKEPIQFWATHLDHRRDPRERVKSATQINKWLEESNTNRVFIAGDFNAEIGSKSNLILQKKWITSNFSPLPTVPVVKPSKQIDFIWSCRESPFTPLKTFVLAEKVASDHRPILATYLIPQAEKKGTDKK